MLPRVVKSRNAYPGIAQKVAAGTEAMYPYNPLNPFFSV